MFRVAVCDDDISMAKKICEYINAFGVQREINFKIEEFHDGEELLKSEGSFDIVFLDIEMRVLGGIETAQEIRKRNMSMPIVYITSHPNYWKQAYKVHAFQFISKPFGIENIYEVMSDFIDFKRDENIVKVSFSDFLLLPTSSRKLCDCFRSCLLRVLTTIILKSLRALRI